MQAVVLVTGLPRSGTSLLMSMLKAGGIPLLTDDRRAADEHNPPGYFEHSAVLRLNEGASWLYEAGGQAVKILSRQIEFVPSELPARVLLTERDINEVVRSQQRMRPDTSALDWGDLLGKELHRLKGWLARQSWPILRVSHRQLVQDPTTAALQIQTFLQRPLDVEAMAAQVDPGLYRNRSC